MNVLTARNKNFCAYAGFFGILISLTCLFQNFIFFNPHWFTYLLMFAFILAITAFSLLIAHVRAAPVLLIITSVLVALGLLALVLAAVISLIVVFLFIYSIVITSILYAEGFPEKFRQKVRADRAEQELWRNKI